MKTFVFAKRGRNNLYEKIVHYGFKWVLDLNHMVEMFLVFNPKCSLSLKISVDNQVMFHNCSIIINFLCIIKSWNMKSWFEIFAS